MRQCRSKSFFSLAAVLHPLPDLYQVLLSCKRSHHEPYCKFAGSAQNVLGSNLPDRPADAVVAFDESLSCMQDYSALHPYIL